jgi:hypothetical protein
MSEVISIIGDSNVNRHLNQAKAANPADTYIRQSHLITAFNGQQLQSSLVSQNEHRKFVVIAALTNPITSLVFLGGDQLIIDVRLLLQQLSSWIQQGRNYDDGTNSNIFILPPQFRRQPSWYRQYYTTIMAIFEESIRSPGLNIWILPPFSDPEFEADGVHYTPASGMLYVQHLVHSAHSIIESTVKPDPVAQSHSSQLQGIRHDVSELRFNQIQINAKQEEETDGRLNSEAENQFVITGLKSVNSDSWQERQKAFVKTTKEFLVGFCPSLSAVVIKFCRVVATKPRLILNVECDTTEAGIAVRQEWAKLVKSGEAKKRFPEITITNSVTHGTRVRCAVLRAYARAYLQDNPEGQASVTSFSSRPRFNFRPSKTVRQNSLTYCETVLSDDLPEPLDEDLEQAYRIAGTRQFRGQLRSTFMILSDDHVVRAPKSARPAPRTAKPAPRPRTNDVHESVGPSQDPVEPMEGVSSQGPSGYQSTQAKTPTAIKSAKRKGSQDPSLIKGVSKLSRM